MDACPVRVAFVIYEIEDLQQQQAQIFQELGPMVRTTLGVSEPSVAGGASDSGDDSSADPSTMRV